MKCDDYALNVANLLPVMKPEAIRRYTAVITGQVSKAATSIRVFLMS
jgi:hypothetical protein